MNISFDTVFLNAEKTYILGVTKRTAKCGTNITQIKKRRLDLIVFFCSHSPIF